MAVLYTIHYDNVPNASGGVMGYTGSSRRDLTPDDPYFARDGSMTARGKRRKLASHARQGVDVVRRAEILWQRPYEDNLVTRELQTISALRHNDPRYGYNLMPQLVGINIAFKLEWTRLDHPRRQHQPCEFRVCGVSQAPVIAHHRRHVLLPHRAWPPSLRRRMG